MRGPRLRVIWIAGAPGAGKSVAAWALFEELAAAGAHVAYVDIDQLGMLYPDADDDPKRDVFKSQALGALAPGYAAAGARTLVVSGVVDPHAGPRAALPPSIDLRLCVLLPEADVLRERIRARGWDEVDAERVLAEHALLRAATFIDVAIDTAGLSVADTVARLRVLVDESGGPPTRQGAIACSPAHLGVLVVTGPRAVGTSTIGFGLAMRRWQADRRTGFLDLQQLGFISDRDRRTVSSEATLAIVQLVAMHNLMADRGAQLLIISGHLGVPDRATLRMALPAARVAVVRLRADSATLEEHVRTRARGSDVRLAGDDLLRAGPDHQRVVIATALADQTHFDAIALDDAVVDVSRRTPHDVITGIEALRLD